MKYSVGEQFLNKRGETYEIIGIVDDKHYLVQFKDEFKYTKVIRQDKIKLKSVANPFYKTYKGLGYIGDGIYTSTKLGKEAYDVWAKIWLRIGNIEVPKLHTYIDCDIDPIWHNFQNFAKWFYTNPYYQPGWHVDKDMAVIGNRIYGPDTCCFLPRELNGFQVSRVAKDTGLPRGVHKAYNKFCYCITLDGKNEWHCGYTKPEDASADYQTAKLKEARRLALKYEGKVDPRVIYNLNNLRVVDNAS